MDKRIIVGAVVVSIVVCVVAVYFAMQYAAAPTYKVSGYVKTDGTALPGVSVTLGEKSIATDANGYYEFTGLEGNKTYTLAVGKSGYENYSTNIQVGTQDKVVDEISLKTVEIAPLAAITSALATLEGVSTDSVELYFCVRAAENDNYAVGAVIDNQKSVVFIYVGSTSTIVTPVENDYIVPSDEQEAMAKFVVKKPKSRHTGLNMVPFNFVKKGNAYSFHYYDGWEGPYPWTQYWGFGTATMDANGNIPAENMTHTWIP